MTGVQTCALPIYAYAENGEKRQLDFDVITSGDSANGSAYPEGTILQLKASEKRIKIGRASCRERV